MNRRNLLMLVASLTIAVLLRLAINPSLVAEVEREFEAPLVTSGLPESLAVVQAPATVILVARGTVTEVDKFQARTVRAVVDLSSAREGTARFQVKASPPVGSKVSLRSKSPTVTVEVERSVTKSYTVELVESGIIEPQFVLEGMSAEPPNVLCTGPASLARRVNRIAATVNLAMLRPGSVESLEVIALDEAGKPVPGLTLTPSSVTVTGVVLDTPQTRQVPVSIIYRGQLPPGFVLDSAKVTPSQAVVRGAADLLSTIGSVNTKPIDLSTLRANATYNVRLDLPDGLSSDTAVEYTVQLTVRKQRTDGNAP